MKYRLVKPNDKLSRQTIVYLGESDPIAQTNYGLGAMEIDQKLKVLSLISDHVAIPVSHLLRSSTTFKVVSRYPLLLSKGVVVPTLSSKYNSFLDYDPDDLTFDYLTIGQCSQKDITVRKEFLEENVALAISWDFRKHTEHYRKAFLEDLYDHNSILCRSLDHNSLEMLAEKLSTEKIITRSFVLSLTPVLPPRARATYIGYVNALYHLNGAYYYGGIPNVPSIELRYLSDKFNRALKRPRLLTYQEQAFEELLRAVDIPIQTLSKLDDEAIVALRRDSSSKKFRLKYNELLSDIMMGKALTPEELTDFGAIRLDLKLAIESEVLHQRVIDRKFGLAKKVISAIAYTTNFLAAIAAGMRFESVALAALGGSATWYGVVEPGIDKIRAHIGAEIIVFCEKYRNATVQMKRRETVKL